MISWTVCWRHVVFAALHVGGHGCVDLLGLWQVQAAHDGNEFIQGLGQAWIVHSFLLSEGHSTEAFSARDVDQQVRQLMPEAGRLDLPRPKQNELIHVMTTIAHAI